jgi:hypothetical protein
MKRLDALNSDPIPWLLEPENPSVRYRTPRLFQSQAGQPLGAFQRVCGEQRAPRQAAGEG